MKKMWDFYVYMHNGMLFSLKKEENISWYKVNEPEGIMLNEYIRQRTTNSEWFHLYVGSLKKNKTESSWILKTDWWLPEVVEGSGEGAGLGMEGWGWAKSSRFLNFPDFQLRKMSPGRQFKWQNRKSFNSLPLRDSLSLQLLRVQFTLKMTWKLSEQLLYISTRPGR